MEFTHVNCYFQRFMISKKDRHDILLGVVVEVDTLYPTKYQMKIGCDSCVERHSKTKHPTCEAENPSSIIREMEEDRLWNIREKKMDPILRVDISRGKLGSIGSTRRFGVVELTLA